MSGGVKSVPEKQYHLPEDKWAREPIPGVGMGQDAYARTMEACKTASNNVNSKALNTKILLLTWVIEVLSK